MTVPLCLGQLPAPKAANPFLSPEFLITAGLLATVLLGGAVALFFIDRWRKRQLADDDESPVESLTSFRSMYERGELTEAEYKSVRDRIAGRMKPAPYVDTSADTPVPGVNPASGARPAGDAGPPPPEPPSG